MDNIKEEWQNIDDFDDPKEFSNYLDTLTAQNAAKRYKRKTYQLLNITHGSSVLDVGCGVGDDVLEMAKLVGSNGQVIGVDNSKSLIEEANDRLKLEQVPAQFRVGDIHKLDFADDTFDGCRADRIFMHLHDRQHALSEMIRVTQPGGRIVVMDPDWETLIVEAPNRDLTRKIINNHIDQLVLNPWCGRESYKLFKKAGLENVAVADTVTLVLTNFSTANELLYIDKAANLMIEEKSSLEDKVKSWVSYLKQADDEGYFFGAVTGFTVVGVKSIS